MTISAEAETSSSQLVDLWISEAVLAWPSELTAYNRHNDHPGRRQHDLIRHVDSLLNDSPTRDALADAVENINKAIDQRITRLTENYSLRTLRASFPNNDKYPEILAALGVIRPMMIAEINAIRNPVNHEDADPPGVDTCKRHAESGWYFLRSTDVLMRVTIVQVNFEEPPVATATTRTVSTTAPGRLQMKIKPANAWEASLQAYLPPGLVRVTATPGHLRVRVPAEEANSITMLGGGIVANTASGHVVFSAQSLFTPQQRRQIAGITFRVLAEI